VVRGGQPIQGTLEHCSVKTQGLDSWNDLATAGRTPEFLNSKAGEILSKSPQQTPSFFFYTHRTCGRVSTPYRINLPARGIYAPAQAQDG
jgi:hypothetical protein